jgi:rod shape-determining protein MreC
VSAVLHPVGDVFAGAIHYGELETQNARLRAEVGSLQQQNSASSYTMWAVQHLDQLSKLRYVNIPSVPAEVQSAGSSNFDETFEIDVGTSSGVGPGMPVVGGGGLIGTVISASSGNAVVQELIDPRSTVGVEVGSAYYRATGSGSQMTLQQLPGSTSVTPKLPSVGESVTTSGQDNGAFPPAIPVGRVASVSSSAGGLLTTAVLEPYANFSQLQFVDVLQWLPPA